MAGNNLGKKSDLNSNVLRINVLVEMDAAAHKAGHAFKQLSVSNFRAQVQIGTSNLNFQPRPPSDFGRTLMLIN